MLTLYSFVQWDRKLMASNSVVSTWLESELRAMLCQDTGWENGSRGFGHLLSPGLNLLRRPSPYLALRLLCHRGWVVPSGMASSPSAVWGPQASFCQIKNSGTQRQLWTCLLVYRKLQLGSEVFLPSQCFRHGIRPYPKSKPRSTERLFPRDTPTPKLPSL